MKRNIFIYAGILGLSILFSCKKNTLHSQPVDNTNDVNELDVPMGGNAYVTSLAPGGNETITATGLSEWTNSGSIFTAWFRPGATGILKIRIKAKLASGNSVIKLIVNGNPFNASLTGSAYKNYDVGQVNITDTGYVSVQFRGVSNTAGFYGDVSDLLISGTAVDSAAAFANDPANFYWSRRGPSVHLAYTALPNTEWFYNEVMVPAGQDQVGSYFMSNGFDNGYFGMQVNSPNERRILFSVWNPDTGTTTSAKTGPGVVATTFTGEGSGGQSYLIYNWKAGNAYKFLTRGHPDGAGNTLYSSWFYAPEKGSWQLIATWQRPNTNTGLTGLYSFLENFIDTNGFLGRQAFYGNQWVADKDGNWTELTTAYFDGDATAGKRQRLDYAGGLLNGQFYLQNGGFFQKYITLNQTFERTATAKRPVVDLNNLP